RGADSPPARDRPAAPPGPPALAHILHLGRLLPGKPHPTRPPGSAPRSARRGGQGGPAAAPARAARRDADGGDRPERGTVCFEVPRREHRSRDVATVLTGRLWTGPSGRAPSAPPRPARPPGLRPG